MAIDRAPDLATVNDPGPELMSEYVRAYVLSCWLYYVADDPILSDREFDMVVGFLEHWRRLWPADFIRRIGDAELKTAGHALQYSPEEIFAAKTWRMLGSAWPATITAEAAALF